MLKVSLIKWSLDNIIYESNPLNANFGYLPFDGSESLIPGWQIYRINDDIVFRLNNDSMIDAVTNRMQDK